MVSTEDLKHQFEEERRREERERFLRLLGKSTKEFEIEEDCE